MVNTEAWTITWEGKKVGWVIVFEVCCIRGNDLESSRLAIRRISLTISAVNNAALNVMIESASNSVKLCAQTRFRGHCFGFFKTELSFFAAVVCCDEMRFAETKKIISQALHELLTVKRQRETFLRARSPNCARKSRTFLVVPQNNWQHWKIMLAFVFARRRETNHEKTIFSRN